jgi:REP element-mobilizing transposase RayT
MPRANRHFLPGYVWHITHRCHRKSFLLKFAYDQRARSGVARAQSMNSVMSHVDRGRLEI